MMYRRIRAGGRISQADLDRLAEKNRGAREPKNGGLTMAEFFTAVREIDDEKPIMGTLKIQKRNLEAAS